MHLYYNYTYNVCSDDVSLIWFWFQLINMILDKIAMYDDDYL